jgi:hypothetical protein
MLGSYAKIGGAGLVMRSPKDAVPGFMTFSAHLQILQKADS